MSHRAWTVAKLTGKVRQMSDGEAAYLAGFIDGEGTVNVYARPKKDGNLSHVLNEHVSVVNTNLKILERVQGMIGTGTIYGQDRDVGNRIGYVLPFDGQRAVAVLKQVQPFLVGKQEQADLVLKIAALREARRSGNWIDYTDGDLSELSEMLGRLSCLNGGKRTEVRIVRVREVKKHAGAPFKFCEVEGCGERAELPSWEYCSEHWEEILAELYSRICAQCHQEYRAERLDQRFCSAKCQWKAGYIRRKSAEQ